MLYVLDSQKIHRQGDARPLCSLLLIKAKLIENFFLEHYNLKICPSSLNVTMMQSVALLLLVYWHPFFILSSSQLTPLMRKLSWPHSLEKTCLYAHNLLRLFCFSLFPLFLTQLLGQGSFPSFPRRLQSYTTFLPFPQHLGCPGNSLN